jgi:hypothetical protein
MAMQTARWWLSAEPMPAQSAPAATRTSGAATTNDIACTIRLQTRRAFESI